MYILNLTGHTVEIPGYTIVTEILHMDLDKPLPEQVVSQMLEIELTYKYEWGGFILPYFRPIKLMTLCYIEEMCAGKDRIPIFVLVKRGLEHYVFDIKELERKLTQRRKQILSRI